ncbi:MAG: hypothetical protein CMM25_04740 [Rhodospirillaceae bacterium]|nr:hypothetical protein [Rhodospirillaceae bacterium]
MELDGVNRFLERPKITNLNFCCPPQTSLIGTAPYIIGRGAASNLVNIESQLRPMTSIQATRSIAAGQPTPMEFINKCLEPPSVLPFTRGGESSRSNYRNNLQYYNKQHPCTSFTTNNCRPIAGGPFGSQN